LAAFVARLKSCPVTKLEWQRASEREKLLFSKPNNAEVLQKFPTGRQACDSRYLAAFIPSKSTDFAVFAYLFRLRHVAGRSYM
jgi:hypothetical protein